jgi:phage terminase large subunit-like protein
MDAPGSASYDLVGMKAAKLRRFLRQIPGYDPYAHAEGCHFDREKAQAALDFFPAYLVHLKGPKAGQPFELEPWQAAIIANLFGWIRADGTRRFREAFIYVPRKNGKTALAAGLVCLVLFTDGEAGAECYSSAADREQARLCFEAARGMIERSPELSQAAKLYRYAILVGSASYKAISAEAGTKHGFNSHLVVNDELHAQKTRELTDVLATSTGARSQPLIVHITTADYEREGSICNEKLKYARGVRDNSQTSRKGIPDPAFLPVVYEATAKDDWRDPKTWKKANPNLGISVSLDYLRAECEKAQAIPSYTNTFKRLHLNLQTKQQTVWLDTAKWDASGKPFDMADLDGEPCAGALDLSAKIDLTAWVKAFWHKDADGERTGGVVLVPRFWIPEETAWRREKENGIPYSAWHEAGFIDFTPGDIVDYDLIEEAVKADAERYEIREIAYDPWNATQVVTHLAAHGLELVEFPQTLKHFNDPTKEFGRLVNAGTLHHGHHPVLTWNAGNVEVWADANGNIRPVKPKNSPNKIDGIVAGIMATARLLALDAEEGDSVYETRGVLTL